MMQGKPIEWKLKIQAQIGYIGSFGSNGIRFSSPYVISVNNYPRIDCSSLKLFKGVYLLEQ